MHLVGLGERVDQALPHGGMHAQPGCPLGREPCCGGGLLAIGLGVAVRGDGVEAHRELLVDAAVMGVGQNVTRIGVYPGETGDRDGDAGFLSNFPDRLLFLFISFYQCTIFYRTESRYFAFYPFRLIIGPLI